MMKPEVIFLHGFLESPSIWKDILPEVEANTSKCINNYLPNHSLNELAPYDNCLNKQAERLYENLKKEDLKCPILIGHSLGGYLALAFIEKYPEYAAGLILVNSTCLADSEERKEQRTRARNLIKKNPNAFIQMAIKNLFQASDLIKHKSAIDKLINEAKTLPIPAIQASIEAMRDRKDRTHILKNFTKKKLYIFGKKDTLISEEDNLKAIKNSNTPYLALESGHMSWLEDKDNLHKGIINFLKGFHNSPNTNI